MSKRLGSPYRSGRSPHWVKVKNPKAPGGKSARLRRIGANTYLDAWRVVLFGMPAALIIYWLAALEQKAVQTPARLLVALGDWSYGTYLTHVLVLSAIGRIIHALTQPGATSSVALIAIGFLAANLVGAFVFRFFERPTLTLLHRFGSMPKARSKCMEKRLLPEISSGRI